MFAFKWSNLLTALLLLLFCLPCQADDYDLTNHITLKRYPSGSFSVRYGGLRGLIRNQLISQFHSLHRDWVELKYDGNIDDAIKELQEMRERQEDINRGGAWFQREYWWDNLPESKGGAPDSPLRVYRGRQSNIIDMGVAYITSDFRFKWREYEVSLTKAIKPREDYHEDWTPIHDWKFRFKPQASFSSSTIIRQIRFGFFFEYSRHALRLISVELYTCWHPTHGPNVFRGGISISFLQW